MSGVRTCPRRRCFGRRRSQVTSHISTAQAAAGRSRRTTLGDDIRKSCLSRRFANRAQRSHRCWRGLECSHRHCLWIRRTHKCPFEWDKEGPLVVAEKRVATLPVAPQRVVGRSRLGRGHGHVVHNGAVPGLHIESGSMRWVNGKMLHWTCKKCKASKEDDRKVPPTLISCAQDGL